MSIALLVVAGKAALPLLTGGLSPLVDIGSSILQAVWEQYSKAKREEERQRELAQLAAMTAQQVRAEVSGAISQILTEQNVPDETRRRLEGYLLGIQAQVQRTFRRSEDPTGRTVPHGLALRRIEDLAMYFPPRPPRFIPGDKVPGTDFTLIELLGIGGFGEVWRAQKPHFPDVAIKFCHDELTADDLKRSVKLLAQLQTVGRHPGIVELKDTFLNASPPFVVYELVEGGDLGGLIVDWHRQRGPISPTEAAKVLFRLSEIVAFAHQHGIIHRDLKPANILVTADG